VVGGLVEQEDVGLFQQQPAQRHTAQLAAGEHGNGGIAGRAAEGVHGELEARVEVPGVEGIEALLHVALAGEQLVHLVGVERVGESIGDRFELGEQVDDLLHALLDHVVGASPRP